MRTFDYDLVVVGAGSGGFAAARTARGLGASVALVDHGPLGGLCILRGCMPSKTFIASSDAIADMRAAAALGIRAGSIAVDFPAIAKRKRELIGEFAAERIAGIREFPTYEGRARFLSPHQVQVGGDVILAARAFIVATGSVVAPMVVPGLEEIGYIDSDSALDLQQLPKSLIVLGGGYIGCELGQFFARLGAQTTMVARSAHLLSGEDHDVGGCITEVFRDEGIEVLTRTQVMSASGRSGRKIVRVQHEGVDGEVEADEVLYCLGRVPNVASLDLQRANVPCHHITGIDVDATMRTCNPDIFAIGDVTGKHMLVHVAIYEGEIAARNAITGGNEKAVYDLQKTHTIFTEPQIAVAGATERELQGRGVEYVRGRYEFAEHGKAMAIGKTKGFVKMMADAADGRILGAAVIGPYGSDLIHEVVVAMYYGATVFEFMRIPHLHPTLAEIWTYPAEECAAQIEALRSNGGISEVAVGGTAG